MKTNDLSMLGELLANSEKEQENQQQTSQAKPAPKKPKPVKEANDTSAPQTKPVRQRVNRNAPKAQPTEQDNPQAELTEAKNSNVKMTSLPGKDIQAEIREFFNDGVDDYSEKLGDYMEDKENALKVLNFLQKNYTRRSGKLNSKVMFLALTAYSVGNKNEQFTDITRSIIEKLSELSIPGYLERNKESRKVFFKDPFLCDIKTVNTAEYADLLNEISKKHVQDVLEKLSEDDRIKYLRSLSMKNGLEQFNPRAQNKRNNNKAESKKSNTGDTTMADKEDTTKEAESTFTPSAVQIRACELAGISDIKKFESEEQLLKAIEGAKYRIEGQKILKTDGGKEEVVEEVKPAPEDKGGKPVEEEGTYTPSEAERAVCERLGIKWEKFKDAESLKEAIAGASKEALGKESDTITIDGEGADKSSDERDKKWYEKKKAEYDEMAAKNEIAGYKWDENVKEAFAAHVEGGYIHYTAPNNVIVDKASGLKVFEVLVTELDNAGRAVNFGPNLEHEQAVKLLAACLIHGNPIGNNPPELSQADLDMLKAELEGRTATVDGKEVSLYEALAPQLEKYKAAEAVKEEKTETKDETKTDDKTFTPKAFDDETKAKIKESLEDQYNLSALEAKGVVEKDKDGKIVMGDDGKPKKADSADKADYDKYIALIEKTVKVGDKEISEKEFLAGRFVDNPEEVRGLIKELVNEKTEKTEAKETNFAKRRKIIDMKKEIRNEDGANNEKAFIAERRKQLQEEMKMALGIIPNKDGENKVDLDYIKNNHINAYTYGRLGGTNDDVAKQCEPIKEGGDAMKEFAAGKQTLKELTEKAKKGGRGA